jgi:hypothetical protein
MRRQFEMTAVPTENQQQRCRGEERGTWWDTRTTFLTMLNCIPSSSVEGLAREGGPEAAEY